MENINETSNRLCCQFNLLNDWTAKYTVIILVGRSNHIDKTLNYHSIEGCQSAVYICILYKAKTVIVEGYSNSLIVNGLIKYFILPIYSMRTKDEIISFNHNWIEKTELKKYLSIGRNLGLEQIVLYITSSILNECKE